jgi:replicative DNA helicase
MSDTESGYVPPHSIEAEQAVLGAIFVDPNCLPEVTLILKRAEMFWRTSHQHIYRAIQQLSSEGTEVDWVSVGERVLKNGAIDECGGNEALHAYLQEVSVRLPSSYGVESHAGIVRDRALLREIVVRAGDIRAMALDKTKSPKDVIERLEQDVFEIAAQRFHGHTHTMQELIAQVMQDQAKLREWRNSHDGNMLPGLTSGYAALDTYTTGWKPGELVVIGARPGQGKTSLMLNLAENIVWDRHQNRDDGKGGVLVFSLEMMGSELVQRILCSRAEVDLKRVKLADYNKDEEVALKQAMEDLSQVPLFVDDSFTLNMSEIRSKSRRMKERYDIDVIFVDYLQLVKDNDRIDRHLQIGNISRGLKALARELEIPVVTAAQLNRGVEQRSSREKRPMLSDLRESGSIEQDADQVLLIHKREDEESLVNINTDEVWPVDLLVEKNRNGPTGTVKFHFHKRSTKFLPAESRPGYNDFRPMPTSHAQGS